MRTLLLSLLLCASAQGQILRQVMQAQPVVATATPAFVSETSFNSTKTDNVSSLFAGTTTCAAFTDCVPLGDPVFSGNLVVVFVQYNHASTAVAITGTDDQSNSYTCSSAGSQVQVGSGYWAGYCYKANVTNGPKLVKIGFNSTTVTQVEAKVEQFYNIATTTPLDTSNICAGTSASTTTCAVTTATNGDLIIDYVDRVGTPAVTSFTAASGFTLGTTDIQDGAATQFKVQTSAGAITPAMVMASSSTYAEIVLAFKAATAGTAPTGIWVKRMMSYSYESAAAGNRSFQFTNDAGSLLVNTNSCNTVQPTGVTDATNTWTSAGTIHTGTANNLIEFYSANATANATGALTVAAPSVTGDCTYKFYEFGGAPTTVNVARTSFDFAPGTGTYFASGVENIYPFPANNSTPQAMSFMPLSTNGISVMAGGQDFSTTTSVNSPSVCTGDMSTQGGENLDGPWPVDQNNAFGHCYPTGDLAALAFNETSTSADPAHFDTDVVSFFGSTGAAIVHATYCTGTAATFVACTVPAPASGNLLVAAVGIFNSTARTASKVCIGGNSSCSTGTQLFECAISGANNSSCVSTGTSSTGATSIWGVAAPAGSPTTVDVVASNTAANLEVAVYEVARGSGSWGIDTNGAAQSAGTAQGTGCSSTGTTACGPAVTTTGTFDFCVSNFAVANTTNNAPSTTTAGSFVYGGTIFANTTDSVVSLLSTSAGSKQGKVLVDTSSGVFHASTMCYK
jgi:hypothetical protein